MVKGVSENIDRAKKSLFGNQPPPQTQSKKVSLRDFQKTWKKFQKEVSIFYEAQSFKLDVNASFGAPISDAT